MSNESLKQYILKKGIEHFISNPSPEEKTLLTGTIYDRFGNVNLNKLYILAGIPV